MQARAVARPLRERRRGHLRNQRRRALEERRAEPARHRGQLAADRAPRRERRDPAAATALGVHREVRQRRVAVRRLDGQQVLPEADPAGEIVRAERLPHGRRVAVELLRDRRRGRREPVAGGEDLLVDVRAEPLGGGARAPPGRSANR